MFLQKVAELMKKMLNMTIARKTKTCRLSRKVLTIIPFDSILFMSSNVGMQFFLAIQKQFKDKRKHHYNEYSKVRLARELIEKEMAELEDDDNNAGVNKQAIL